MKPVAYKYQVKGQKSSYGVVASYGALTAIEAQEYPDVVTSEPLYAIDFTKYKLVPREPTEEMIDSGNDCHDNYANCPSSDSVYEAMIEAAPDIEDL